MKRAAQLTLLLCLASTAAPYSAAAAQLSYTVYVLGLPVADASVLVDLASSTYRLTLRFHTTGLAGLVTGSQLEETVRGQFDGDRLVPRTYTSNGRLHRQDRVVDMTWSDGNPVVTAISPPNDTEREDVPPALRAGTIDPLSAIVQLLRLAAQTGRCEGSARTYDGRDLHLFAASTAGEEDFPRSSRSSFAGRALRCDFTDQPLAGFRFGADRETDSRPHHGTIWLAPILPGLPGLPVRLSIATRWLGDATIYLTAASP